MKLAGKPTYSLSARPITNIFSTPLPNGTFISEHLEEMDHRPEEFLRILTGKSARAMDHNAAPRFGDAARAASTFLLAKPAPTWLGIEGRDMRWVARTLHSAANSAGTNIEFHYRQCRVSEASFRPS